MISLNVVKIRVPDPKYLLTRKQLEEVRELFGGLTAKTDKETHAKLTAVLKEPHVFANKKKFSMFLDTLKLEEIFYVWSTRRQLSERETEQISKLVNCAINAPNTLLVFPEYIIISSQPPSPAKKTRKRKDKGNGPV